MKIVRAAALALAACLAIVPTYYIAAGYRIGAPIYGAPAEDGVDVGENIEWENELPSAGENDGADSGEIGEGNGTTGGEEQSPVPPKEEENVKEEHERLYVECNGNGVNLRTGAGVGYAVAATAQKGEIYAVVRKTDGWYCVYRRGKQLYFSAKYAKEIRLQTSENEQIEKVLEEGYALLGTPYVFGAVRLHDGAGYFYKKFTTNAFDCSSLTQYVFYRGAKKYLGVTTRDQVKQGKPVKRSELSRGDCIYFTNASRYYNTGTERVGHVAIYLGDDYILHTSSDYARIEKMTAARKRYYIESRRFV